MNVDLGIWDKLTRVVIVLILAAIVLGVAVWYLPLIRQNERMRQQILKLNDQIAEQENAMKDLRTAIESLHSDTQALERLARERFSYGKPGETIIRFEDVPTNTAPPK